MRRLVLTVFAAIAVFSAGNAAAWETVDRADQATAHVQADRADSDQPDVWVRGGYVYITTSRPVTVKIFSILGQLISQENVPVGTYRLQLASRGIYILKAGTLTRRITL